MIVVCKGWEDVHADERILGEKEPLDDPRKSDTICPLCREEARRVLERLTQEIANETPSK